MKLITLLFTSCMFFLLPCTGMDNKLKKDWTKSRYLNTKYLSDYKKVEKDLIEKEGFTYEIFTTKDDHAIHGIFYNPKNSPFTVIFCAGWLPGRKEGMIPFYPMLKDQNCSMLFFDARGHGKSHGSIIKSLPEYGQHEYKDILAAIEFIHKKKNHPIYILGICAGAFHASHALINLSRDNKLKQYNIKGFIFDSGWASFTNVAYTVPREKVEEFVARAIAKLCCCRKYHRRKNTWIKKATSSIVTPLSVVLHTLVVRLGLTNIARWKGAPPNEQKTNLHNAWKKHCPNIPILFIHSQDDPTNIKTIQSLAQKSKNATCWWIDKPSKHACNNLIHKEEYKKQLVKFFKKSR